VSTSRTSETDVGTTGSTRPQPFFPFRTFFVLNYTEPFAVQREGFHALGSRARRGVDPPRSRCGGAGQPAQQRARETAQFTDIGAPLVGRSPLTEKIRASHRGRPTSMQRWCEACGQWTILPFVEVYPDCGRKRYDTPTRTVRAGTTPLRQQPSNKARFFRPDRSAEIPSRAESPWLSAPTASWDGACPPSAPRRRSGTLVASWPTRDRSLPSSSTTSTAVATAECGRNGSTSTPSRWTRTFAAGRSHHHPRRTAGRDRNGRTAARKAKLRFGGLPSPTRWAGGRGGQPRRPSLLLTTPSSSTPAGRGPLPPPPPAARCC
jgi:hypothetical protein